MNIHDYMEKLGEIPELSSASLTELLGLRANTFYGFMEREHDKGIMFAPYDLRTPKGQDSARLLFWRCVEEYAEAISASSVDHRLEEIIDAFNYASAGLVATKDGNPGIVLEELAPVWKGENPTYDRMGRLTYILANVTETFRNRAWMENSQSNYFDGMYHYRKALLDAMRVCCYCFNSWEQFWKFFMAKDMVLQFRLRSKY